MLVVEILFSLFVSLFVSLHFSLFVVTLEGIFLFCCGTVVVLYLMLFKYIAYLTLLNFYHFWVVQTKYLRCKQSNLFPFQNNSMSLSDVTFTEARTISGRKVNLIMANGSGSPVASSGNNTKTVVLEQTMNNSMDGLQHVVSAESIVKKVSDIVIKPKVSISLNFLSQCGYFL